MATPFPMCPFVKTPQPWVWCSLHPNLGVGLSTALVSVLCLLLLVGPAEACRCFILAWVSFQRILWHEKSSSTRIWDITELNSCEKRWAWGQVDFPRSDAMYVTLTAGLHWCDIRMTLPHMLLYIFIFLNCLSLQLSGRNFSSPLLKAKTARTRPSLLCEKGETKIPTCLYKDLRQNNSGHCCRSRPGRKPITP